MHYTQDESYYMLDAAEDATVYLGVKEGIEPEEMIDAIIEGIRKSIFVETKTSITLDYDDTEKED